MLRKFQIPVVALMNRRATAVVAATPLRSYATPTTPEDDAEFEFFEDDLWFLDELCGEDGADMFPFIPEDDATLLGHERK